MTAASSADGAGREAALSSTVVILVAATALGRPRGGEEGGQTTTFAVSTIGTTCPAP